MITTRRRRASHWIPIAIDAAMFLVALGVLQHILTQYHLQDIIEAIRSITLALVGVSAAITTLGYAALVGYDFLSLRITGHPVPVRRMWTA
ncbi:MAG: hypothetical protein ACREL5_09680, partial [Gemmatimonadales bacterium]